MGLDFAGDSNQVMSREVFCFFSLGDEGRDLVTLKGSHSIEILQFSILFPRALPGIVKNNK